MDMDQVHKSCLSLFWGKMGSSNLPKVQVLLLEAKVSWSLARPENGGKDPQGAHLLHHVCLQPKSSSCFKVLGPRDKFYLIPSILSNYPKVEEHFSIRRGFNFFSKFVKNVEWKHIDFVAPVIHICIHKDTPTHGRYLQICPMYMQ